MDLIPDQQLDARHLRCPMPVLKTNKILRIMQPGQILEVLADDEGSLTDMPEYCRTTGHALLTAESQNGQHRFLIRRKAD